MKRIIFSYLLFVVGVMCASAQAVIKFDKNSHNFGSFAEETPVSTIFYFTNTGDQPLIVQQAMSTCGCTVANYTKDPVKPGEKGQIKVTYNGKGKPSGHFKKVITVRTNASNSLTRLYIEGTMKQTEEQEK